MSQLFRTRARRSGTMLIIALVVLSAVMVLAASLSRTVLMHRHQLRHVAQQQQSQQLAEAAVQRAWRKLMRDPEYRGETWQIADEVLGEGETGTVRIQVQASAEDSSNRRIVVESMYPERGLRRFNDRRELVVPLPSREASSQPDPDTSASRPTS